MRTNSAVAPRRPWAIHVVLLIGVALLVSCAGPSDQPAPGSTASTAPTPSSSVVPSPPPSPPTSRPSASGTVNDTSALTLVYKDGDGQVSTWQLSCEPPSGTHFDPEAACAALGKNGATALPAVARGKMCTQIYSGPQTADLRGTYHSQLVNSRFSRTNGCETARWTALEGLLPVIKS